MVTAKPKKTSPTWIDVKGKVADFDRAGLLGVLQDLYAGSKVPALTPTLARWCSRISFSAPCTTRSRMQGIWSVLTFP
jgi:hypothetical protein